MNTQALFENSLFGVAIFGQDSFVNPNSPTTPGLYYSKIFQKKSTDIWHQIAWTDNSSLATFGLQRIEVRTRTGNQLPINHSTGLRYTIDQLNSIIETQNISAIDTILERATLNRSIISDQDLQNVDSSNPNIQNLGTSYNSFRINRTDDTIWNYFSLPITSNPSFIPNNVNYDYMQARISLQSSDNITMPEMFRINFTSILKN